MHNSLTSYFNDISPIRHPEYDETLEIYKNNSLAVAQQIMIERNLHLVVGIAKKHLRKGIFLGDLISFGNFGLIRAAEKYDVTLGYKFGTYATWQIRQYIQRGIHEEIRQVRLPEHIEEEISFLHRKTRLLANSLGRDPLDSEIAKVLNLDPSYIRFLHTLVATPASLDRQSDEEPALYNMIKHEDKIQSPLRGSLERELQRLTEREQEVVRLYYGFDDGVSKSYAWISRRYNVTRERIRQIKTKALKKLKRPTRIEKLREFL